MNSNNPHTDLELIRRYYKGEMTNPERNALEQRALDDPFLKDAMDGYDADPGSFGQFNNRHLGSKVKLNRTLFTAFAVLIVLAVSVMLLNRNYPENKTTAQTTDSIPDFEEVEMIPEAIETLVVAETHEQISVRELVDNSSRYKTEIQDDINETQSVDNNPINIDPEDQVDDNLIDTEPIAENKKNKLEKTAPATFLHDMYVVDYRFIKRSKNKISYLRYELPGISAAYENDSARNSTDLVERQVDVPYVDYLDKSMDFFARGSYKKALSRFTIIMEQYPKDINAQFYGGLCYYNLKQPEKAFELFRSVSTHELVAFREESKWYMAKSLLKLGRKSEAMELLDEIIAAGGFYSGDAIALKKLETRS